ncbi:MAG: hypothetical protein ACTSR3_12265 [Candidatus Helarchaeota archaeon]
MNEIKIGSLQFSRIVSEEKISALSEKFENYLSKSYKIVAKKIPYLEGDEALKKNYQILYYLKNK